MAVRQNQGLQIALIIFALLMIVTGVCEFMFFRWYEEAVLASKASVVKEKKAIERETLALADVAELKKLYGAAPADALATIKENFNEDMKNYAADFKEADRHYRQVVKNLHTELLAAQSRFVDDKVREEELKAKIAAEEQVKKAELAKVEESLAKSAVDLGIERDKFNESLKELERGKAEIAKQFEAKRKESDDHSKKATEEVVLVSNQLERAGKTIESLKEIKRREDKIINLPRGRITRVDQRDRIVWINVGPGDGLRRQVTFKVLGPNEPSLVEAKSKASIEVVRMLDNHLAEARIVSDKVNDPIVRGDQIFSQAWAPGRVEHFALAGFMDIDGDHISDRELIKNLIATSGGVVDAEVTDAGKRVGDLSLNTSYMIVVPSPSEKGVSPEYLKAYSEILAEGKNLGIPVMRLEDFLNNVGYVAEEHAVAMDSHAEPTDFKAKPRDGILRKSSEQFAPRKPNANMKRPSAY